MNIIVRIGIYRIKIFGLQMLGIILYHNDNLFVDHNT